MTATQAPCIQRRRQGAIPRPWLNDHNNNSNSNNNNNNRHGMSGKSTFNNMTGSIPTWEKPHWTVSWRKLTSCFFCDKDLQPHQLQQHDDTLLCKGNAGDGLYGYQTEMRSVAKTSFDGCYNTRNMDNDDYHYRSNDNDDGSSSSSSTCSDLSYDKDDNDEEYDDLTEGGSDDDDDVDDDDSISLGDLHHQAQKLSNIMNPAPAQQRKRQSSGSTLLQASLPPRWPSSTNTNQSPLMSQDQRPQHVQKRRSTADYSRASSTASKHQRSAQFHFSIRSVEQICSSKENPQAPPLMVLCSNKERSLSQQRRKSQEDSGYTSPLDYDSDEEHGTPIGSKLTKRGRKNKMDERTRPRQPKNTAAVLKKQSPHKHVPTLPTSAILPYQNDKIGFVPDYLRKHSAVDEIDSSRIILSGWVACSAMETTLLNKLRNRRNIDSNDMRYMRVVETADMRIVFQCYDANLVLVKEFEPESGWRCETQDISAQIGQCVIIRDNLNNNVCTILPVSLGDRFFASDGKLVCCDEFTRIRSMLFAEGVAGEKAYAPNEQHDAVFFIRFALDCLLRERYR